MLHMVLFNGSKCPRHHSDCALSEIKPLEWSDCSEQVTRLLHAHVQNVTRFSGADMKSIVHPKILSFKNCEHHSNNRLHVTGVVSHSYSHFHTPISRRSLTNHACEDYPSNIQMMHNTEHHPGYRVNGTLTLYKCGAHDHAAFEPNSTLLHQLTL